MLVNCVAYIGCANKLDGLRALRMAYARHKNSIARQHRGQYICCQRGRARPFGVIDDLRWDMIAAAWTKT